MFRPVFGVGVHLCVIMNQCLRVMRVSVKVTSNRIEQVRYGTVKICESTDLWAGDHPLCVISTQEKEAGIWRSAPSVPRW